MSKQVKSLKQKIKARLEKISKHEGKLKKLKKKLKKQKKFRLHIPSLNFDKSGLKKAALFT